MKMNWLDWIVIILVIIGALNWLLVGLFGYDVVAAIFGAASMLSRAIYVIIGIAGIYLIYSSVTKMNQS